MSATLFRLQDAIEVALRDPRPGGTRLRALVRSEEFGEQLSITIVEDTARGEMVRRTLRFDLRESWRRTLEGGGRNRLPEEICNAVQMAGHELGVGRPVFRNGTRDPLRHRR